MDGVSKKLTITGICIMAIMNLAGNDPSISKLPHCIVIGTVCLAYLVKQTILDYKKK